MIPVSFLGYVYRLFCVTLTVTDTCPLRKSACLLLQEAGRQAGGLRYRYLLTFFTPKNP